jgi:hypothetical protein
MRSGVAAVAVPLGGPLIHLSLPSWACSGLPDKLTGRPALRQE